MRYSINEQPYSSTLFCIDRLLLIPEPNFTSNLHKKTHSKALQRSPHLISLTAPNSGQNSIQITPNRVFPIPNP